MPEPRPSIRSQQERRARRRRGSEVLEFTLSFLPMIAMICVLVDISWAIFAKSTLQRTVRIGVRTGVTLTADDVGADGTLTGSVKAVVQKNALGLLNGASGLSKIKVHYFQPPAPSSTSAAIDVSAQSDGNQSGNIMEVSVENYSLVPLLPRIFVPPTPVDNSPLIFSVSSADLIEPSRTPAPIGTAP